MLNADTKATLKLWNRLPDAKDSPEKVYPIMTGYVENRDFKLKVSAYLATDKTGEFAKDKNNNYMLTLSIGNDEDGSEKFYGVLYKEVKEGKKNTYFGYITKSQETGTLDEKGQKVYQTIWQLSMSGKLFIPAESGKKRYIGCDIYPKKSQQKPAESSPVDSEEIFF